MKKKIITVIILSSLLGNQLDAGIREWFRKKGSNLKRGIQCAFASKKYNCSKQERETARKWLIGSSAAAITVAATAAGATVAYQRAQQAKEQAAREQAALEATGDATPLIEPVPQTVEPTAGEPAIPAAPAAPPVPGAPTPAGPLVLPAAVSLEALQQISKEKIGDVTSATTPFGKFFERIVKTDATGSNIFQTSLKKVKELTKAAKEKATTALGKVGEVQQKFADQAKEAYDKAMKQAQSFISDVRQGGPDFYKQMFAALFDINYQKVKEAIVSIQQSMMGVGNDYKILTRLQFWEKLNAMLTNWNAIQKKGYALYKDSTGAIRQILSRKKEREGFKALFGFARKEQQPAKESQVKLDQEMIRKYPLAVKFDALVNIYPRFIQSVRQVNLISIAQTIEVTLKHVSQLLNNFAQTYDGAGVWGKLLLNREMIDPLRKSASTLEIVGPKIKAIMATEPLQKLARELPATLAEIPLKEWFSALLWHPSATADLVNSLWDDAGSKLAQNAGNLQRQLKQATALSDTLKTHSTNMWKFIKQNIERSLEKNPLQNYVSIAKEAVIEEAKISKDLFNDTILHTAGTLNYLEKVISGGSELVQKINDALGKEFLSSSNVSQLQGLASQLKIARDELAALRNAAKKISL